MLVGLLVAGRVLEPDVLRVGGDLEHRLHVAEGRAEDQLVALARHVAEHALGVGRLRHVLDERGLDLVAELLLDRLAARCRARRSSRRRRPGRRRRRRSSAARSAASPRRGGHRRRRGGVAWSSSSPPASWSSSSFLAASRERGDRDDRAQPASCSKERLAVRCHGSSVVNHVMGARRCGHYPGKNGLPIDAGMLTRMNEALREMRTSTTIVARYGSMVRNWLDTCTPSPCRCSCSIVTPPNR